MIKKGSERVTIGEGHVDNFFKLKKLSAFFIICYVQHTFFFQVQ